LLAESSIRETAGPQMKPDQDVPQRQHAQIGGPQARSALPVDFHGTIQLAHSFFSHPKPEARKRPCSICRRNQGYAIAWRIDQHAAQAQSPPEPLPLLNPQATMQPEFNQPDRRWENPRVHQPHHRRGQLLTSLAESGQQTPIVVVAAW